MDLQNMSTSELRDLQKELISELKGRGLDHKDNLGLYRELYSEFGKELESSGLSEAMVTHIINRLEKSILLLCDYALGNYGIKSEKVGSCNKAAIIAKQTISDDVRYTYPRMADDILEVIKSYRR